MNKVKIILSAITVISAIGGAFALKAKKIGTIPLAYSPTAVPSGNQPCPFQIIATKAYFGTPAITVYIQTNVQRPCNVFTYYYLGQ